jgi:cytochrome c oxidase subunit 2
VFLSVPIFGVLTFLVAPQFRIWFPTDISEHGRVIDGLFMFILWLTGIIFVITEVALFLFMWKYSEKANRAPAKFTHGSHTLEVVWTILPAVTLLFIAIYQMNAWADAKMRRPDLGTQPDGAPRVTAEITGRQFNWDVRYPGEDGILHTADDVVRVDGDIRFPVGEEVLLVIKSADVLHSFFLPNLRMKQDVVPGMEQYMWFKAKAEGEYDIVCAELCGWGHYKMKARATFLPRESRSEGPEKKVGYNDWLKAIAAEQRERRAPAPPEAED